MKNAKMYLNTILLLSIGLAATAALSQVDEGTSRTTSATGWHAESVVYVAGLADVKPGTNGALRITPEGLHFSAKDGQAEILRECIRAVSVGDERVATGGIAGKVARLTPVYGVGPLMGLITNKKVDVLTVEYVDGTSGYHGAVFEIPKNQGTIVQQQLSTSTAPQPSVAPVVCAGPTLPNSLLIAPITADGVELPAEYRVLLYEQLVAELGKADTTVVIYRAGASGQGVCPSTTLRLSVTGFKKGNEAVRASTGAIGLFVGSTSVTFHVEVANDQQRMIFEKDLKKKKHGDSESLSVARDVAKDVSKRLIKEKAHSTQVNS